MKFSYLTDMLPGLAIREDFNKRKRKRHKRGAATYNKPINIVTAFPPLYPSHLGTPKTTPDANLGGSPISSPGAAGGAGTTEARQSRARVFFDMKRITSVTEDIGSFRVVDPSWTGYSVPNPLMMPGRGGEPFMAGPGFGPNAGPGGVYDFAKSPGIGFRSAAAWRVWQAALNLMTSEPQLPVSAIFQAALARAGLNVGRIDPSEIRLIEMGIQWYLGDPQRVIPNRESSPSGF